LDVVKDNYKTLAQTQQEGVPQSWGTDNPCSNFHTTAKIEGYLID
jgi:hypothetical protein